MAVAAPLQLREGQGVIEKLTLVLGEGILRVHAAGETLPIEDFLPRVDENTRAEDISIVVDRAKVSQDGDLPTRLRDSVARAFSYGNGVCRIVTPEGVKEFSARFEADGIEFEPPTEHLFSFNNPLGACPTCEGYGKIIGIDEDLVIPDKRKTIYEDAVACWRGETMRAWKDQLVANAYKFDFPIHTPFYQLTAEQKRLLWRGNEYFHGLNDFFAYIDSERRKIQFRVMKARYTGKTVCPDCGGSRLRKEALYVRIGGKTIADLVVMPVETLAAFLRLARAGRSRHENRRTHSHRDTQPPAIPHGRGTGLPDPRPALLDAFGRREPAHQSFDLAGQQPRGLALYSRRAVDRPAPARHEPSGRCARTIA